MDTYPVIELQDHIVILWGFILRNYYTFSLICIPSNSLDFCWQIQIHEKIIFRNYIFHVLCNSHFSWVRWYLMCLWCSFLSCLMILCILHRYVAILCPLLIKICLYFPLYFKIILFFLGTELFEFFICSES